MTLLQRILDILKEADDRITEDGEGGAAPAGVPANNAGTGNIAGLGVGPKGEPGVDLRMSKKRKKEISALATHTGTPIAEAKANNIEVKRLGVAPSAGAEFWKVGDEVFRAPYRAKMDTTGQPMGKRWECTYRHWLIYRTSAYGWVEDLKERLHESPADTFGIDADVFDVDMDRLLRIQTKASHERYKKYLDLDEVGEDIRAHARKNPKRDIVLRDSKTGVMRFLRRRATKKR
jgi:hypothetical protein